MLELQAFPQLSCDFCEDQRRWDIMTRPDLDEVRVTSSIPGSGRSPEKEMTMHSSNLAWRIPWTEEPGGLQSMGHKESETTE